MSDIKQDPILEEFKAKILSAGAQGKKLRIVGGNTKSWYGDNSVGEELNTRDYRGIVDYQPSELVLTAKAGTPMQEIEQALISASQWFPFEPPTFGTHSTIGGVVCAGLSGPGRGQYGALRDFVLGVKIMDGRGDILTFGGQVMKNVAGYDVSRLMPGSLGTLGLLLEVSIKVLPIPAKTKTLAIPIEQKEAINQMNRWASQPLPLSASCWLKNASGSGELMLRLAGANAAVEAACKKILEPYGGKIVDDQEAQAFWYSIKEQTHPFFQLDGQESLWRFAVNPLSDPLPIENATCIEWLGGQRWVKGLFDQDTMKKIAHLHGGHVTLFRGDKSEVSSAFTSLKDATITAPLATVQERIRKTFDPYGIFQTNRMP